MFQKSICLIFLINFFQYGLTVPKKYESNSNNDGGFLPSTGTYYTKVKDSAPLPPSSTTEISTVIPIEPRALDKNQTDGDSALERVQRFGLTGYGAGYGGTAGGTPGVYAPLKIDLGGVVLGAIIGLGAVLVLPKLAYVFSHSYGGGHGHGGYGGGYRNVETTLTELMSNLETALEKYNIDSSSCMQRLVCTTVQSSQTNMEQGLASTMDQWVQMLTKNQVFSGMLDGTAIKEAVDAGWSSDSNVCEKYYPKCTIDKQKILQMVSNLMPSYTS